MQQTLMILSETEEINSLLYKPIIATQRIKYTCLNVSANYIVLGSSSGSLYLFSREPCTFQQLVPLSEGPVSCVAISPDEKTIALATKRGSVCLVAVRPTVKLLAVSSEHLGELVTTLCWNSNSSEIYVGDGIGKVSTMVLSIFTVNGMFQPQSLALMHLDSTIIQMHFSSKLLLISTMTRCYICDTIHEHFKQIGNKARDGEFGACFLEKMADPEKRSTTTSPVADERRFTRKGTFNLISDANVVARDDRGTKIYCARPGCRLWEVTTNGTVVKTHQFKDALAIPPSMVYRLNSTKQSANRHQNERSTISQTTNFSRLYVLRGKYLFTHTTTGLYIIDPTNAAVILWNNDYVGITMIRAINEKIYLMTDSGIFHCLTLSTPESLILHLYEKKCYNECLRACNVLRPELLRSIGPRDDRNVDAENTNNAENFGNNEITATVVSLISLIQSNVNGQPIKLTSGIVVVNAGNGKIRNDEFTNFTMKKNSSVDDDDDENNSTAVKTIENEDFFINDVDPVVCDNVFGKKNRANVDDEENLRETFASNEDRKDDNREVPEIDSFDRGHMENVTSKIQTDLNPLYVLINNLKPDLSDSQMEKLIIDVKKSLNDMNENYGNIDELKDFLYEVLRATERHYYNVLLENTTTEFFEKITSDCVVNEIVKAFADVNITKIAECSCGFSYPTEVLVEPKFFGVGRSLLDRFAENRENSVDLCKRVPYMWREYSTILINRRCNVDDILRLCLRTRDDIVLATILPSLDVEQWKIVVEFLTNVEKGICPHCRTRDGNSNLKKLEIDWNGIAREILKRDGSAAATDFLLLVERNVRGVTVDRSLFQSVIFTKILERHGLNHAVEFDRNRPGSNEYEAMCSPKIQEQLVEALEKDLEKPIKGNIFGIGSHHWGIRFQSKSSTCPCCTLSLQTPVLLGNNGISLFPCGHAYHVSCLIQRKLTRCNLHG